jgi:predicted phosphodiesterase
VVGLLYDVHGNLNALEAVLLDAEERGVERFLLGGDYAAFGGWPEETVARLRELDARWIRGNVDRWTADPSDAPEPVRPALTRCAELLGSEEVERLAGLPESETIDDVLYCHASPGSDVAGFAPEASDEDAELLLGVAARRVVFGHTHLQFRRLGPSGIDLVNPGSVGIPLDGDRRAAYAVVGEDVELRRVEYDHAASAARVREILGDAGETFARRIEQARFDVA